MATVVQKVVNYYNFIFHDLADPRTSRLPLMGSPFPGIAILGFYLYFVLNLGPRMMKNRPPMQLKTLLAVFNIFQVTSSVVIFYKCLVLGWATGEYKLFCQPVDFSMNPKAVEIAWYCWFYVMLKMIDLLDTVFIVLRKNQRQVTFLHVYHHTAVVMAIWGATKYYPGGHGTLLGMINSFVHAIMYSYYLLATIAPEYCKRKLGWKKYITQLQMTQFVILGLHALSLLLIPGCEYQCKYPYAAIMVPQNFFMFMLFYNFYQQAYSDKAMQRAMAKLAASKKAS